MCKRVVIYARCSTDQQNPASIRITIRSHAAGRCGAACASGCRHSTHASCLNSRHGERVYRRQVYRLPIAGHFHADVIRQICENLHDMKIDSDLLQAAASVRTLRGLHDWLIDAISKSGTDEEANHLCTIFAWAIEPLIGLALIDAETSQSIWSTFDRLRSELGAGARAAPDAGVLKRQASVSEHKKRSQRSRPSRP